MVATWGPQAARGIAAARGVVLQVAVATPRRAWPLDTAPVHGPPPASLRRAIAGRHSRGVILPLVGATLTVREGTAVAVAARHCGALVPRGMIGSRKRWAQERWGCMTVLVANTLPPRRTAQHRGPQLGGQREEHERQHG